MRARIAMAMVLTGLFGCAIGCGTKVDKAAFVTTLNKSYDGRHVCVWPEATKLPATIDPTKDEKITGFEALTDAGLLMREYVEKKEPTGFVRINKYDLSDKGHTAWSPEANQAGFGNFCFGHFNVTAIDKATPDDRSSPTRYTVNYSYEVEGIPGWARTPESMRAFRKIAADTSIQSATATLVKDGAGGWAVAPEQPAQ